MDKVELSAGQIENLARPLARMAEKIMAYYDDPEHERAFQEWLKTYRRESVNA